MFGNRTKKYMSVAGQSFFNDQAEDYYRQLENAQILDKSLNNKSTLENIWGLYSYGAEPLNNYYNRGVTEFLDELPSVTLTGTSINLDNVKNVLEQQTGYTNTTITSSLYAPYTVFDIKWTMNEDDWFLWYQYIRYILQQNYQYDDATKLFTRTSGSITNPPIVTRRYKIDWEATGDPLGIIYNTEDSDEALANTDYTPEGNGDNYQTYPFIVANIYTSIRTVIERKTTITITNIDLTTDSKRTLIEHITTEYNEFGNQIGQSTETISDTTETIPIGSETPSENTVVLSDTTVETIGDQVTWFMQNGVPNYTTYDTYPTDNLDLVSYYFVEYTTETGENRVWIYKGNALPIPTVTDSNAGDPYNPLSVLPVATLMNNDSFLSEDNNPELYKNTNRLLDSINLNVDMLKEATQTKEAPDETVPTLRRWYVEYLTDTTIPSDTPSSEIIDMMNERLKTITLEESTAILDAMIVQLEDIRYWQGGRQVINPNPPPDFITQYNPPEIRPWEDAYVDLLNWINQQRTTEETATGRIPDDLLIIKRMNVYIRDKKTTADSLDDTVSDIFVMAGVNPLDTSFQSGYDWSLPDLPTYSMTEERKQQIRDNYAKKGISAVSKVLFSYFKAIYTELGVDTGVGGSNFSLRVRENNYNVLWEWKSIGTLNIQTIIGNVCPRGKYMHIVTAYKKANTGTGYTWDNTWYLNIKLYYQNTATTYQYMELDNGRCTYRNDRRGVSFRVPQASEDPTDGDIGTNRAVLIPLPLAALKQLSLTEKAQLYPYSLHMIIYAYKKVKQKWYQTGIFKFIMFLIAIVVTIVVTIINPPAGVAVGYAVVVKLVVLTAVFLGMQLVIQLVMASGLSKSAKVAIIAIASVAAIYAGGGFSVGSVSEVMTTAANIVNVTVTAYNIYIQESLKELAVSAQNFRDRYEERLNEFDERRQELNPNLTLEQLLEIFDDNNRDTESVVPPLMSVDSLMYMSKEAYLDYDLLYDGNYDKVGKFVENSLKVRIDI